MTRSWIFDFDGTLINSEALIRKTFIKITKKFAPHRLDFARNVLIGPPLKETSAQILGSEQVNLLDNFINNFIESHDQEILIHTQAYENTNETLNNFFQMGHKMAIATNKRKMPTLKIINHLGWEKFFLIIECSDSEIKIRDKSKMIQSIINKDNDFKKGFFVGDTLGDASASSYHNLKFIKAKYGYGEKQDWESVDIFQIIENFKDLAEI